jgi:hypothetical protein
MKPFFSFRVPDKRSKACILRRRWPLLCHKRFHQCSKGLSLWMRAQLPIFPLHIRTRRFDFGKARPLVIEKAGEVFTQVDQQMIAVSDLNRLWSAMFDRLCIRAGSIATHDLDLWMRLQPGHDGRGFATGQQINRTVVLQIHQNGTIALAFFQRSGKGNDVAIVPSPKNRAGHFRSTRLKPFVAPVSPDAVSPRVNPGYELADGRWDEAGRDFLLDLILLWIARAHDGCAIP